MRSRGGDCVTGVESVLNEVRVLDWTPPLAKWFVGGRLNLSVNCLDRHLATWRRNTTTLEDYSVLARLREEEE